MENTQKYSINTLNKSHQRTCFSCGIESLDEYIQKQASQDHRKQMAVTYVLNDDESNKIAGYYTLSSASLELHELTALPGELSRKLPKYPLLPATLMGRLAIDKHYQKLRLGEVLLMDALRRAYQASQEVASFVLIVEAINDSAISFYKKYGFRSFTSHKNKLYLPMKLIKGL